MMLTLTSVKNLSIEIFSISLTFSHSKWNKHLLPIKHKYFAKIKYILFLKHNFQHAINLQMAFKMKI